MKVTFKQVSVSDIIPDEANFREAANYFPEGNGEGETPEERATNGGIGILERGTATLSAFQLEKTDKGLVSLDGNRRFWQIVLAAKSLNRPLSDIKVPANIYTDLTEAERLQLRIGANLHAVKPGMWAQAGFCQRLMKNGDKHEVIARTLNCTVANVSTLSVLAAMPPWVMEAGMQSLLSPTTVLELYASQKGKKNLKIDATIQALEAQRNAILVGEVSRESFGIKSRIEQARTDATEKTQRDSAVSKYSSAYAAIEAALKTFQTGTTERETLKTQFKDRLAKIAPPSDEKHPDNAGKDYIQRHDVATKALEALLADIKAASTVSANGTVQPKGADQNGLKPGSTELGNQGIPPVEPPIDPEVKGNEAGGKGQGETEAQRLHAAFGVALSEIVVLCDKAPNSTREQLAAKVRSYCNAKAGEFKLWA